MKREGGEATAPEWKPEHKDKVRLRTLQTPQSGFRRCIFERFESSRIAGQVVICCLCGEKLARDMSRGWVYKRDVQRREKRVA